MSVFSELKRRNVLQVGAAYVVVAWVIIEVAVTLREGFPGMPIWIVQALIVLLALGIVPVLILSWFYELTPEGLKRDSEIGGDRSYADTTSRRLIYATVAFVVIGVAMLAWIRGFDSTGPEIPFESVVVLPFTNLSSEPENEYFSDGLTDTLRLMLRKASGLTVAPAPTSRRYKDQDDIRDFALEVGVAHVLTGNVQRSANRVRVIAQLIRAEDLKEIWSDKYDREVDDIFAIQDDIASSVGTQLLASILGRGEEVHPKGVATNSIEAYDLYLRARAKSLQFSHGPLEEAEALLNQALAIDPGFLEAKIELAWVFLQQAETGSMRQHDAEVRVAALAEDVLGIDPTHPQGQFIQLVPDLYSSFRAGDLDAWDRLEPRMRAAIEAAPGDTDMQMYLARLYRGFGEKQRALEIFENLARTDLLNPEVHRELGTLYDILDQFPAAERSLQRSIELEPRSAMTYVNLATMYLATGKVVDFLETYEDAIEVDARDPELPEAVANLLYHFGFVEDGDRFRDRVIAIAPDSYAAIQVELSRALAVGDNGTAAAVARQIIEDRLLDRCCVWPASVYFMMRHSALEGSVADSIDFIDEHLPGFADLQDNVNGWVRYLRLRFLYTLPNAFPMDDVNSFVEMTLKHYASINRSSEHWPELHVGLLIYRGDVDEAIQFALDAILSKSVIEKPDWRELFDEPHMQVVAADPRVAAGLARWDSEFARMQSEIEAYLEAETGK